MNDIIQMEIVFEDILYSKTTVITFLCTKQSTLYSSNANGNVKYRLY